MKRPGAGAALPVILAAAALTGCAGLPPPPADEPPALTEYARNAFVPVNLYVNANEHVPARRAEVLEHAAAQIAGSGAFLRVDRGVQRWMYTLQMRFRDEPRGGAADTARRVLGALTLGLVPVRVGRSAHLDVAVYLEPEPVGEFSYSEAYADRISVYDLADPGAGERAAVERLLRRMLWDFATRKIVPRAKEFDAPPAQPPPKKRKGHEA